MESILIGTGKRGLFNKISIPDGCEISYPESHGTDRILYRFKVVSRAVYQFTSCLGYSLKRSNICLGDQNYSVTSLKKKWIHKFKNWSENFKGSSVLVASLSYLSQQNTSCCDATNSGPIGPVFMRVLFLFTAWKKTWFYSVVQIKFLDCQQGWYDDRDIGLLLLVDSNLVNSQMTKKHYTNVLPEGNNVITTIHCKCLTRTIKSLSMKQKKVNLDSISQASEKQCQRYGSTENVQKSLSESSSEVQERKWDKAWRREEDISHNVVSLRKDVKSSDDLYGNHEIARGIRLTLLGIKRGLVIAEQLWLLRNMSVGDMVKKDMQSNFAFGLPESDSSYPYYLGLVIDRSNDSLGVSNSRWNQQAFYFEIVYYSSVPLEIDGFRWHEFARESLREATFESFSNFDKGLAEQLSRMGFFYTGEEQRGTMICYYCHVGVQNWQPEDGINVLHTVHLSGCQMKRDSPSAEVSGSSSMIRNEEMVEEGSQGSREHYGTTVAMATAGGQEPTVAMATAGGEQSDMEVEETVTQSHRPQRFNNSHQFTASAAIISIGFQTPPDDSINVALAFSDTETNDPTSPLSTSRPFILRSHSEVGSANIETDSESTEDSCSLSGQDDSNLTALKGLTNGATPSTSLTASSGLVDSDGMAIGSRMSQDARPRSTTAHIWSSGRAQAGNSSPAEANSRRQGHRSHHLSVNSQIYSIPTQAASVSTTTTSTATSSMPFPASSIEISNRPLTYQDLGIIYGKPRDPGFALLSSRLESFTGWPEDLRQRPDSLARAGFYYLGYMDCCKCFYCGGGLRSWERDDDPHVEHARWYPRCVYISQSMGNDFVHVVQDMSQRLQGRPRNNRAIPMQEVEREMERQSAAIVNYFEDGPLSEDPAVKAVIEGGFDRELVLSVAQRLRAETAALSTDQIVQNIAQNRSSSTTGSAVGNSADVNVHAEVSGAIGDAQAEEGAVGGAVAIGEIESSNMPTQNVTRELESLKGENYSLRNRFLCKICMDREVRMVFLPCGHFITCMECSVAILDCPLCRQHIRATVRANIR